MQVELLEAKTETFGPLRAARVAAMSARHLARARKSGLRPAREVCAAWGMARSSLLRHDHPAKHA